MCCNSFSFNLDFMYWRGHGALETKAEEITEFDKVGHGCFLSSARSSLEAR